MPSVLTPACGAEDNTTTFGLEDNVRRLFRRFRHWCGFYTRSERRMMARLDKYAGELATYAKQDNIELAA